MEGNRTPVINRFGDRRDSEHLCCFLINKLDSSVQKERLFLSSFESRGTIEYV